MKWIKKIFTGENNDIPVSDLSLRVAEIESRIATLKRGLEQSEKSSMGSPTLSQPLVDKTPQQSQPVNVEQTTKEAEMMELKSKLLGKKS